MKCSKIFMSNFICWCILTHGILIFKYWRVFFYPAFYKIMLHSSSSSVQPLLEPLMESTSPPPPFSTPPLFCHSLSGILYTQTHTDTGSELHSSPSSLKHSTFLIPWTTGPAIQRDLNEVPFCFLGWLFLLPSDPLWIHFIAQMSECSLTYFLVPGPSRSRREESLWWPASKGSPKDSGLLDLLHFL